MSNNTYFDILGVSKLSTQDEINDAYIKLVKLSKTDKNINLYLINEAYNILKNPLKRFNYERSLELKEMNNNNFNNVSLYNNTQSINDPFINNDVSTDNITFEKSVISSKDITTLISNRQNDLNNIIQETQNKHNLSNNEFNKMFDEQMKQQDEQFLYNNLNDDNTNFTVLNDDNLAVNERFNDIKTRIDIARDTGNTDEYIKLREEEQKIITNF